MSFVNTDQELDKIFDKQNQEIVKKRRVFFDGLKQEIHSELKLLKDWKLFFEKDLKKGWDDLELNKITREIIKNINFLINDHKTHCPICEPTRWGDGENSFKE